MFVEDVICPSAVMKTCSGWRCSSGRGGRKKSAGTGQRGSASPAGSLTNTHANGCSHLRRQNKQMESRFQTKPASDHSNQTALLILPLTHLLGYLGNHKTNSVASCLDAIWTCLLSPTLKGGSLFSLQHTRDSDKK